jgi:glycosyltransferase involved in cell wall biosynthesis
LVERGHEVTVLTSRFDAECPLDRFEHGVRVVRAPVLFRISKGVIMPTIGLLATKLVRQADVICLHLPQFDAAGIAARGRLMGKPTTLTYHCDLKLPPGPFNWAVNQVVHVMNYIAGVVSDRVIAYTGDFARASPFLRRFAGKLAVIPPPVTLPVATDEEVRAFALQHNLRAGAPVIGMAARLASEKGVEVLLDALPQVLREHPQARVLFAGQHEDVLGEEAYAERLQPLFERYAEHWDFLGVLTPAEMASFLPNLDVIVVPSLNSTETFGLVQVEAMLCGTPSVASNLPGVRQPVAQTGMGEVVPIGDSHALAVAINRVIGNRSAYILPREAIAALWSNQATAAGYEALFEQLLADRRRAGPRP